MTAGPPAVVRDVERALDRHGFGPRRLCLVSPLGERKGARLAYRADAADGRRVKARHFGTAEDASRHFDLRQGLEAAFAPALARFDAVVIEEWIDGKPLEVADEALRLEEAGALLARLHERPLAPGAAAMVDTRSWIDRFESDLAILLEARALTPADAVHLRTELRARDPGSARVALIHLDFCAENMVIDGAGGLRVVDNELVSIGPAAFDLGRTFHRWPMPSEAWQRFVGGYRSAAARDVEPTGFWQISAALTGARVFSKISPERLPGTIDLLRRFAAGECLSDQEP